MKLRVVKLLKVIPSPLDQAYKDAFTHETGHDMTLEGAVITIRGRQTDGKLGPARVLPLSSVHWYEPLEDSPPKAPKA